MERNLKETEYKRAEEENKRAEMERAQRKVLEKMSEADKPQKRF
jgi:hypothetical protein